VSIETRVIDRGEEDEVIDLLDKVWGDWPHYEIKCSKREYWDWKYRENPLGKEQVIIAKKDDAIVGCFHRIPVNIKIGLKVYLTSAGTDVAVHPDYRKQGIYNEMLDDVLPLAEKLGVAFQWGITGNPILVTKGQRMKYGTLPYSSKIYTRINDLNVHIKNTGNIPFTERIGFTAIKSLNKLKNTFKQKRNPNESVKIEEIDEYDSSIENFWYKIQDEYKFIIERKRDYMNWRYCRSDIIKYRNIIATKKGETLGYAVIKIDEKDPYYKKGYVVDLLAHGSSKTVCNLLIDNIVEYMRKKKVNFVCCVNSNPSIKAWERCGFLNSRREVHFQYPREHSHIGDDEKRLCGCRPEEIHFCYGDGDWI
jgi:GNAT superfamily N-acetyltransferase